MDQIRVDKQQGKRIPGEPGEPGEPGAPGITGLAICFAGGIAAGRYGVEAFSEFPPGGALAIAAGLLLLAFLWSGSKGGGARFSLRLVWTAVFLWGLAWMGIQSSYLAQDDLAAQTGETKELVRLQGVVEGSPRTRTSTGGSMGDFSYRSPSTYFPLRVTGLTGRRGEHKPLSGRVSVKVEGTELQIAAGDRVEVRGFLLPPRSPMNPGGFDSARHARMRGRAGLVTIPSPDLIKRKAGEPSKWLAWRAEIRRRASGWLSEGEPDRADPERKALLEALLLGTRAPELDGLQKSFQHLGLAHLLAISGMHLGIMAGLVLLLARHWSGGFGRGQGWLVIGMTLAYLFLVETRMPVLRAGAMTICACLGLVWGRRLNIRGLVALSAIGLLLWRPDDLFSAGFQLSFGVVLALIHLTGPARRAWFGPPDYEVSSVWAMLRERFQTALTATLVAWLVATPLVLFHFGLIAPLGIPLTILALPLVTLILGLGYLKMIAGLIFGGSAALGWLLDSCVRAMIGIVRLGEWLPGSFVPATFPGVLWTMATLGWVWVWLKTENHQPRRRMRWLGLPLVGWAVWPMLFSGAGGFLSPGVVLRIDMLSVGNGSCYLVRSEDSAVIFDAGSSSAPDVGRRLIVPALHRLGVSRIDAVVISHPNLDHYSGVLEIADFFPVNEVLLTPSFLDQARRIKRTGGPEARLIDGLKKRGISRLTVASGEVRQFGRARWTWLHPGFGDSFTAANDASTVILIEAEGRRVLLTGDLQREGMEYLQERGVDVRADIVELPHHGSFSDEAATFLERVHPEVVMQSTGRRRWENDHWGDLLAPSERLVTTQDGACTVIIERGGAIRTERFRKRE